MSRAIPASQITFHPSIDPNGKLFWWNGEPYRAIRRHHAAFTQRLFGEGTVERLVTQHGLVPTEPTDWTLPGYGLVLRHHKVPFNALATEWCAPMYRDAALALLALEAALEAQNLMLQDGHTGNLMFAGARPVFVDFCSIIPNIPTPVWEAEDEFRRNFLHPLRLMAAGQTHAMRWMLPDDRHGLTVVSHASSPGRVMRARAALWSSLPSRLHDRLKHERYTLKRWSAGRHDTRPTRARRLDDLQTRIAALSLPAPEGVVPPGLREAPAALRELLARLNAATVLSLGPAEHGVMAAQQGIPTAHFAADEAECERLYQAARTLDLPLLAVRPLARDAHDPLGWRDLRAELDARYRADLVLATGVPIPDALDEQRRLLDVMRRLAARWLLLDGSWPLDRLRSVFRATEPTDAGVLCSAGLP